MSNSLQKSTPVAILVIYDKGFKFKYKKYFIRKGINVIGSHVSCHCQIVTDNAESIPQKAAILNITDDLATVQPLTLAAVYVLSNIKRKTNVMVEIPPGSKYVVQMEKDFLICGRKALMQISSLEQLLQIKGAMNQQFFDLNNKSLNQQKAIPHKNVSSSVQQQPNFQATVPIQDGYNFQPTVQLGNTYQLYQATQLIDEGNQQAYDATLPLDLDLIPQSYKRQQVGSIPPTSQNKAPSSQKQSYISLKQSKKQQIPSSLPKVQLSQNSLIRQIQKPKDKQILNGHIQKTNTINRLVSQAELSMPSTIKQDQQMPATIKQDQYAIASVNVVNVHNSTFPPTIQQSQNKPSMQQARKKLTKSEPVYRQMKNQKFENIQLKQFHSYQDKKQPLVDSFEDLFGGVNNLTYSNKTVSLKSSLSNENDNKTNKNNNQRKIKQTNSDHASQKTQKVQSQHEQHQQMKNSSKNSRLSRIKQEKVQQSQKEMKKCFVLGKINQGQTQKLKKKGYQIVKNYQDQPIDLLLIQGQLKLSKILMISLIKGIEIKPVNWTNNQNAKFSGKLQGFLWQHIQKRKGKGEQIFNKQKSFYLQQQLQSQYEQIMRQAGANLVHELTKARSKIKINIIIDEKSDEGKQLYQEKKNYKNWSFYRKRMIIESILMGEEVLDKYKLDAYSF